MQKQPVARQLVDAVEIVVGVEVGVALLIEDAAMPVVGARFGLRI